MKNQKGFSLIELMVVVAIIGILSAIAVPNYQKFQRKARTSEAKNMLSGIYTATNSFRSEWGYNSSAFEQIGFAPNGDMRYQTGWLAAQEVGPTRAGNVGYTGTDYVAAMTSNTNDYCIANPTLCRATGFATASAIPAAISVFPAAANTAAFVFIAGASGDVGLGPSTDQWSIDQGKVLQVVLDGT